MLQDAVEERLSPAGEAWRWAWTLKGQGHGALAELHEGGHFALVIYRAELFTRGKNELKVGPLTYYFNSINSNLGMAVRLQVFFCCRFKECTPRLDPPTR